MSESADLATQFRKLIGAASVETGAAVRAFRVDGLTPRFVLFPASVDELSRCAAVANQAGLAVIPVGDGTHLGVGHPPQRYDVALSTRRMRRVIAHEAADMTVTVEAGVTLAMLNDTLAAAGQRLPLDPPHPEHATIGGLIATDASGPLRFSQGKVRDLLIGISVVLADGTVIKGGGRVVKNVAGYDLMKLFTGSFGTLGIIVEATFKVRPCPAHEAVFVIPAPTTAAACARAQEILAAPVAPLYVEVLNRAAAASIGLGPDAAVVVVGCGGSADEVAVQQQRLVEHFGPEAVRVYEGAEGIRLRDALRDFPAIGSLLANGGGKLDAEGICGCKLSLLPTQLADVLQWIEDEAARRAVDTALLAHAGNGIAALRFHLDPVTNGSFAAFAEALRAAVRRADGWVVFDVLPVRLKEHVDPWGTDVPATALMRGIKQTLDPHGRLSPGRFVAGI